MDVIVGVSDGVSVSVGVAVSVGINVGTWVGVGVAVGKASKVAVAANAVWPAIFSAVGPQADNIQANKITKTKRFIGIFLLGNQLFN